MRSVGGSFDLQPHVGQRGRPGNLIENPNLGNDMGRRGKAKIVKTYTFAETAKYYERICKDLVARQ